MPHHAHGRILKGDESEVRKSYELFDSQPVDLEFEPKGNGGYSQGLTTLGKSVSVTGPGTFFGNAQRTLTFLPTKESGWHFERTDLPDCLPIDVTVKNVWPVPIVRNAVSSIVLLSGSPHNYMRMVEHIISLRVGLGVDNVLVRMDSGDPPLLDRGSLDLVEAFEEAGIVEFAEHAPRVTVREPVTVGGPYGSFLTLLPPEPSDESGLVHVDCAIDFRTAIGKQRLRYSVTPESFREGAYSRTNTSFIKMLFCKTIGKLFADTRNLGYTINNVLIARTNRYLNEPRMMQDGKSLEAVWHRSTLDLLAAIALIDRGRFVGRIKSYKAGHTLDVELVRLLYKNDLLVSC